MFIMTCLSEPDGDGHQFEFRCKSFDGVFWDAVQWCKDTFGAQEARHGSRWMGGATTIWMRDSCDALHFKMRWC